VNICHPSCFGDKIKQQGSLFKLFREFDMRKKNLVWTLAIFMGLEWSVWAGPGQLSMDNHKCSLTAENQTLNQILDGFKQQTGLQYDLPPELRNQVIPMVSFVNLSPRDALMKILEGIDYDYILVASTANSWQIARLTLTEKSSRVVSAGIAVANNSAQPQGRRRFGRQVVEDPFSAGPNEDDENANMVMDPASFNAPPQGSVSAQGTPSSGPQPSPQGQGGASSPQGANSSTPYPGNTGNTMPGMNNSQGIPGLQSPNSGSTPIMQFPGQNYPQNNNQNTRRTPF
jgi:hypothetical protein